MGLVKKVLIFGLVAGLAALLYPFLITPQFNLPQVEDQWFGKTKLKSNSIIKNI